MPRTSPEPAARSSAEAGFTLLEVLAAVAVAGVMLSAISAVVAVTFAGVRSADDRVALALAGRSLLAAIPAGDALLPGTTTGTLGATRWTMNVTPLPAPAPVKTAQDEDRKPSNWQPAAITISATNRTGRTLRLDTLRLMRRLAP